MTKSIERPDLCVIGAGSSGLAAAFNAARLGQKVALFEPQTVGGSQLNLLYVQALQSAGRLMRDSCSDQQTGIKFYHPKIDLAVLAREVERKDEILRKQWAPARLAALGIELIKTPVQFIDDQTCEAQGRRFAPKRFVLACGAMAEMPALKGIDLVRPLWAHQLPLLSVLPTRLIILGLTMDGVQLAQSFQRLGCETTLIDKGGLLPEWDWELVGQLRRHLLAEGISLRENAPMTRIEPRGSGVRLFIQHGTLEESLDASHLICAHKRIAQVPGIDFARMKPDGRIGRSSIHVVGDASGFGSQERGKIQALSAIGLARSSNWVLQWCYSDPEIAWVGQSEHQLANVGTPYIYRYQSQNDQEGTTKLILDKKGRLLGGGFCGPHAREAIAPLLLALAQGADLQQLRALIGKTQIAVRASLREALWQETLSSPGLWQNFSTFWRR